MSFLKTAATKSTILITGGASGIGLALAKRLIALQHTVVVVGRRESQLQLARNECPDIVTIQADISNGTERKTLMLHIAKEFPSFNVLINNAAVNRFPAPLTQATEQDWEVYKEEINTDLIAPIHLAILFLPHLVQKQNSLIVNVTCETAFVPVAIEPAYSAAKGELQSLEFLLV